MQDFTSIALFLGGGSAIAVVLTQVLKNFFDKYINSKFKNTTAQVILFVLCLVTVAGGIGYGYLPDYFKTFIVLMFTGGVSLYDVVKGLKIASGK